MVIHTGIQAGLLVAGHGIGRDADDGGLFAPAFQTAHAVGGLDATHDRHLHVHQHQVPSLLGKQAQSLFTIGGWCHDMAPAFQHMGAQLLIDRIVLNQQHLQGALRTGVGCQSGDGRR